MNVVACPSCSKQLKYNPQQTGKQARCPACQTAMILPGAPKPSPPANQPVQPLPTGSQQVPQGSQMDPLEGQQFGQLPPANQQGLPQTPAAYPQSYPANPQTKQAHQKKKGINPVVLWSCIGGGVLVVIVVLVVVLNGGRDSETTANNEATSSSGSNDQQPSKSNDQPPKSSDRQLTTSPTNGQPSSSTSSDLPNKQVTPDKAVSKKKLEEALTLYKQSLRDIKNWELKANMFKLLEEAVAYDPSNVEALIARGKHRSWCRFNLRDKDKGESEKFKFRDELRHQSWMDFNKAIELDPNSAEAYAGRANNFWSLFVETIGRIWAGAPFYKGQVENLKSLFGPFVVDEREFLPKIIADYEKAIELAPNHTRVSTWKTKIEATKKSPHWHE